MQKQKEETRVSYAKLVISYTPLSHILDSNEKNETEEWVILKCLIRAIAVDRDQRYVEGIHVCIAKCSDATVQLRWHNLQIIREIT